MELVFIGERKREFGIVGPVTGVRYAVQPGQPVEVSDADGPMIVQQYPALFKQAEAAPEKPVLKLVKPPRGDKAARLTDLTLVGSEDEAG